MAATSGQSDKRSVDFYSNLRYNILPPVFLVFFTCITQVLVVLGNGSSELSLFGLLFAFFTGLFSTFAWKVVLVFYAWCFLSLKVGTQAIGVRRKKSRGVIIFFSGGVKKYLARGHNILREVDKFSKIIGIFQGGGS